MKIDIKNQYNKIGKQYLLGQQSFFSKREDQENILNSLWLLLKLAT
jgi:hypothetical protein